MNKNGLGEILKIDKETPGKSRRTLKAESFPNNNVFVPVFSSNFSYSFGFPVFLFSPFPQIHGRICGRSSIRRGVQRPAATRRFAQRTREAKCAVGRARTGAQRGARAACSRSLGALIAKGNHLLSIKYSFKLSIDMFSGSMKL